MTDVTRWKTACRPERAPRRKGSCMHLPQQALGFTLSCTPLTTGLGRRNIAPRLIMRHTTLPTRRDALMVACLSVLVLPSFMAMAMPQATSVDEADVNVGVDLSGRPWAGPSVLPQPERLVGIGDLHGDLRATRKVLRLVGVLHEERDEWIGGKTVVVQIGDQLDRGDDELDILALLYKLRVEAEAAGGGLHIMLGNHETMTAADQMVYGSRGAFKKFEDWSNECSALPEMAEGKHCELYTGKLECLASDPECKSNVEGSRVPPWAASRYLALRRGGALAKSLFAREWRSILVVGDTVFVHGGLLSEHLGDNGSAETLDKMNREMAEWIAGDRRAMPAWADGNDGLFWTRTYSQKSKDEINYDGVTCNKLQKVFSMLPGNVTRMVVGHTPQTQGANEVCNGGVWRIDVGMSRGVLGGKVQALEIRRDQPVRILMEGGNHFEWVPDQDEKLAALGRREGVLDKLYNFVAGKPAARGAEAAASSCAATQA